MDLMLPVINKIENGTLVLQDYVLQDGQVNGFCKALEITGKPEINHLFLDNCNLSD